MDQITYVLCSFIESQSSTLARIACHILHIRLEPRRYLDTPRRIVSERLSPSCCSSCFCCCCCAIDYNIRTNGDILELQLTAPFVPDKIFSLGVENERADAGMDGRTRLAKPNSQTRTGMELCFFFKNICFLFQLTTSRIGDNTRLIHTLLTVLTIHTILYTRYMYNVFSLCAINRALVHIFSMASHHAAPGRETLAPDRSSILNSHATLLIPSPYFLHKTY